MFYVPEDKKTYEVILAAVKNDGTALQYVPSFKKSYEIINKAVESNGLALKYVPKKMQNIYICMTAIENDGRALEYVAKRLISKEMCMLAVENTGAALKFVPKEFLCSEIYEKAAKNSRDMLSVLPKEYQTKEFYRELIKNDGIDGKILSYIRKNRLTRDMCIQAVKQNGFAIEYVPHRFMTKEIVNTAISQNALALKCIPEEMRTFEICIKCLDIEPKALKYIPVKFCSKELCLQAIERDGDAAQGIPAKYKNDLDIVRSERKLGLRQIIKKCYQDGRFFISEKIPECKRYDLENDENIENIQEKFFESFDEFYQYLDGNLSDVDFGNYKFENINLNQYDISDSIVDTEVLRKLNLYDDSYYARNIRSFAANAEMRLSENNEQESISVRLDEYELHDFSDQIVYYISDLHLDHKILRRFPKYGSKKEIESYIIKIVEQIINSVERNGMLLIAGDVSYRYEICNFFYLELVQKWRKRGWNEKNIIVILGITNFGMVAQIL